MIQPSDSLRRGQAREIEQHCNYSQRFPSQRGTPRFSVNLKGEEFAYRKNQSDRLLHFGDRWTRGAAILTNCLRKVNRWTPGVKTLFFVVILFHSKPDKQEKRGQKCPRLI